MTDTDVCSVRFRTTPPEVTNFFKRSGERPYRFTASSREFYFLYPKYYKQHLAWLNSGYTESSLREVRIAQKQFDTERENEGVYAHFVAPTNNALKELNRRYTVLERKRNMEVISILEHTAKKRRGTTTVDVSYKCLVKEEDGKEVVESFTTEDGKISAKVIEHYFFNLAVMFGNLEGKAI
jgi:hypothetical protein